MKPLCDPVTIYLLNCITYHPKFGFHLDIMFEPSPEEIPLLEDPMEVSQLFFINCLNATQMKHENLLEEFLEEPIIREAIAKRQPPMEGPLRKLIFWPEHDQRFALTFEIPDDLPEVIETAFTEVIERYQMVFSVDPDDVGTWQGSNFVIDVGDALPIKQPPRKIPPQYEDDVAHQIDEMLKRNIIRKSNSAWSSPMVLVPRKNKTKVRIAIDYRALNEKTKTDAYPLPVIDEVLARLGRNKCYITLDIRDGYHNIVMDPDSIDKTAFVSKFGLFEYLRMPFGVKNGPAQFQRAMEDLFQEEIKDGIVLIYIDDLIIAGFNQYELINNLIRVLHRMKNAGIKINPEKCTWFREKFNYLGFEISTNTLRIAPQRIEAIRDWPTPKTVKDIRSFLGMTGFSRRFIPNYSAIARPLSEQTGGKTVTWTEECQKAFDLLRQAMMNHPVLIIPDVNGDFILSTDASANGIGAMLSQVDASDGREHPVTYISRTLTKHELNYIIVEKEALAIVWALEHSQVKCFIWLKPFVLRCDNRPLTFLKQTKNPKGRLMRWIIALQQYKFIVRHVAGKLNNVADALSRKELVQVIPQGAEDPDFKTIDLIAEFPQPSFGHFPTNVLLAPLSSLQHPVNLVEKQNQDPIVVYVKEILQNIRTDFPVLDDQGNPIQHNERYQLFHKYLISGQLKVRNGILGLAIYTDPGEWTHVQEQFAVYIPEELRQDVLETVHSPQHTAHGSSMKMYKHLQPRVWWPNMKKDIKHFVNACPACQKTI